MPHCSILEMNTSFFAMFYFIHQFGGQNFMFDISVIMLISFLHSIFSPLLSVACVVVIIRNVHLDFNFLHKASQGAVLLYLFDSPVLALSLPSLFLAHSLWQIDDVGVCQSERLVKLVLKLWLKLLHVFTKCYWDNKVKNFIKWIDQFCILNIGLN